MTIATMKQNKFSIGQKIKIKKSVGAEDLNNIGILGKYVQTKLLGKGQFYIYGIRGNRVVISSSLKLPTSSDFVCVVPLLMIAPAPTSNHLLTNIFCG